MAEICPFRGYTYNPSRVRFDDVVAPPYDKIADPSVYHAKSPYSIVHVNLPGPERGQEVEERYRAASELLSQWMAEGVLVREKTMAIYAYHQLYTLGGKSYTRKGMVCLLRLEKPGGRRVQFHEQTKSAPKLDRLLHLRSVRAHLGHVFLLYSDPEQKVEKALAGNVEGPPRVQATLEGGVLHRLWAVTDREAITAATHALADLPLTIADGHHRYETAWTYRSEVEEARGNIQYQGSAGFRMVTLVNTEQPALHILATHRLVLSADVPDGGEILRRFSSLFSLRRYPYQGDIDRPRVWRDFLEDLRIEGTAGPCFGILRAGDREFLLLVPLDRAKIHGAVPGGTSSARRELDVTVLHEVVLPALLGEGAGAAELDYAREPEEAAAAVSSGRVRAAFLLNPTRLSQVHKVADEGERMPPKSTDFFPKLASGIVIHKLED
ncbi:MAG: DUF1015 domain-containing protein [Planctomycetes bacterium]|nr:DUF1015 domain-containing protein [Planctomycetota bacterium]